MKPAVWTAPLLRVHFEHLAPCPEDEAHSLSVPDGLLLVYGFGSHLEGWLTDRTSDATTRRLWYKIGTIILAAVQLWRVKRPWLYVRLGKGRSLAGR